jgi:ribosomal-protein-alanine N-acetyltransferase
VESEIVLRQVGLDDIEAILTVQELSPGAASWTLADYQSILSAEGITCLLAEDLADERPAGFLLARCVADEMEILNLAVVPFYRRRGTARRLVGEALARARACGTQTCWLEVRASNQAALAFYRAVGFFGGHRRRNYYSRPVEDAVVLVRRLEGTVGAMLPCDGLQRGETSRG